MRHLARVDPAADGQADRWHLRPHGIRWDVRHDRRLPHEDHLEMSGRRVSLIVRYGVDEERRLSLAREVIWPMLRGARDDVRGYLRRTFGAEVEPRLRVDGQAWRPGPVASVAFDGVLTIAHRAALGLRLTRRIFPSPAETRAFEEWILTAVGGARTVEANGPRLHDCDAGLYGEYTLRAGMVGPPRPDLASGTRTRLSLAFEAWRVVEPLRPTDAAAALRGRRELIARTRSALVLQTPEPAIDRAFELAKLRAAESIFDTRMGPVHSPGGGRYYGGIWANDQGEYGGPFFPFLGEPDACEAALNAYRICARAMTPAFEMLPSSFEVEGDVVYHAGGDRGDAAMVGYGAARYALATGDRAIGLELWPAIAWCIEYCRRKTNAAGVVESDTDELEGRFPTGSANLSTSTLAYGALRAAADLGRALGRPAAAADLDARANALRLAIERHFGAQVEGHATYRYFEGNHVLRSWICLPLVMGIDERAAGTVEALLSPRLWTPDGLATQAGERTFWDRSTLYALRGVLAAGATEAGIRHLLAYTRRRLLGEHVPYPVEAWPEGGQAHLSAESALYCRAITEGLFGIVPTGFRSLRCLPRLPDGWPDMALRRVRALGGFDLAVARSADAVRLVIRRGRRLLHDETLPSGRPFEVSLE
ncbi:MAG: hypothetical protein IT208_10490 [Chthonomonadales bacterium]|nr:hypothetical protein [Chthonomonadales bacterium]